MPKIRVLVVDDSVVIRRMLSDLLSADPEIEVVGTAPDGQIAISKLTQVNPDLITLDMEMPVLDGIGTLKAVRKIYPRLPVIMFSTLTERGAVSTLDALANGANDYVTKPSNLGSVTAGMTRIKEELLPKIKALCRPRIPVFAPHSSSSAQASSPAKFPKPHPVAADRTGTAVEILAIGVSTGGPNALAKLLPDLLPHFPIPVVLVQHMPPLFTRMLAERIKATTGFNAREGQDRAPLLPGDLWVAPGGTHMDIEATDSGLHLRIFDAPPVNSCRPAVDPLFQSVAVHYGPRALGLILTGMGQDGLNGCRYLREAGAQVLVQDEQSSIVWGMPGAVAEAGLADEILPLDKIAAFINTRVAPLRASDPMPSLAKAS